MLYTLTFRVFLLAVATSPWIMRALCLQKNLRTADVHPRHGRLRPRHVKLTLRLGTHAIACRLYDIAVRGAEFRWPA